MLIAKRTTHSGLAMVEFVVTMPLLILLMLATAELGRAFYQFTTLEKAVRDGTRYLAQYAINGTTGVIEIDDILRSETANLIVFGTTSGGGEGLLPGLTTNQVTVEPVGEEQVQAQVNYFYQPILAEFPVIGNLAADIAFDNPFSVQVTMRAL